MSNQENCNCNTEGISKSSNNIWFFVSALLIGVILGYSLSFLVPGDTSGNVKADTLKVEKDDSVAKDDDKKDDEAVVLDVDMNELMDDDAVKGNADAPVTIVEFSDYECPFCARYVNDSYSQIKTNYIDTGKVKYVFRDLPLSFHKQALPAALAAECAGDQDKYYDMHDKIFASNSELSSASDVNALLTDWAVEIGLDKGEFESCLVNATHKDEVQKDQLAATKLGIRGTPAFIINGIQISGAQPYAVFEDAIERALEEK